MKPPPLPLQARNALKISQLQLAQLLDVSMVTVEHWEDRITEPTTYQLAILRRFVRAGVRERALVKIVPRLMATMGPVAALAVLLNKGV